MSDCTKKEDIKNERMYNNRNEISLIDLWFILCRRRMIVVTIFCVFLLLGVVTAFIMPDKYTYTTSIEIGYTIDKERELIDSPEELLAKIKESYIPLILHEYAELSGDNNIYHISARVPAGSNIIVLESKGPEDVSAIYLELQNKIVAKVVDDHRGVIEVARLGLNVERKKVQLKLSELRDRAKLFIKKAERLDESAALLVKQIQEVNQLIALAEKNRMQAVSEVEGALDAMALMVLDNEIQQNRVRLAAFEERLYITLPNQRDDLKAKLEDNKRAQARQSQLIDEIDIRLSNARETKAIVSPMKSLNPVGTSKKVIVVLSAILGILIGVFAAFFVEFVSGVRSQLKNDNESTVTDPKTF